jgi:hypothetical protein
MGRSSSNFFAAEPSRVARGFIFKPKIQIGEKFGRPYIPRWQNVAIVCGRLEYFTDIWDMERFVIIWYIFPALVSCIKKNLATLQPSPGPV